MTNKITYKNRIDPKGLGQTVRATKGKFTTNWHTTKTACNVAIRQLEEDERNQAFKSKERS